MSTNWLGMPSHPTDGFAFWQTKGPELEKVRARFDALIRAATGHAPMSTAQATKELEELMRWAAHEASLDEAYNQGEG